MPLSAEAVANEFIALSKSEGRPLSNMQLQKLVYIAHGFSLALFNSPLTFNDVKAWQYGPVYPKLYKKLRKYGAGEITDFLEAKDKASDTREEKGLIKAIWKSYGNKSAAVLSALTHKPDTPWSSIYREAPYGDIPNDMVKAHYEQIVQRHAQTA